MMSWTSSHRESIDYNRVKQMIIDQTCLKGNMMCPNNNLTCLNNNWMYPNEWSSVNQGFQTDCQWLRESMGMTIWESIGVAMWGLLKGWSSKVLIWYFLEILIFLHYWKCVFSITSHLHAIYSIQFQNSKILKFQKIL